MNINTSFEQCVIDNLGYDEDWESTKGALEDLIRIGAENGFNGFIYTDELKLIYDEHETEIEEILDEIDYQDPRSNMGLSELISKRVWAALEVTAACLIKRLEDNK